MSISKLVRQDLGAKIGYQVAAAQKPQRLRLNANENPWPPAKADTPLLNRYPEKQPAELVDRLADIYQVAPENLLVTRGADDGIDSIIRGFCEPAVDKIVHCPPTFAMYRIFAQLHGAPVIDVPLNHERGFACDFSGVLDAVDQGAKVVFLCSPNNPTGSLVDRAEILNLVRQVEDRAIVVVDEAYIEFSDKDSVVDQVESHVNLVVLRTLSKAFSLAGLRIGSVIACCAIVEYLKQIIVPYPMSRASVAAALKATGDECIPIARRRIEELISEKARFQSVVEQFDWMIRVYPSWANFLLIKVADSRSLLDFAEVNGILLRDQSDQPGLENCVRISMSTPQEMNRLVDVLRQYEVYA